MTAVALPAIAEDMGVGLAAQQWVVAGFLVALGSLLLVGGALDDIYDRWRIFGLGPFCRRLAAYPTANRRQKAGGGLRTRAGPTWVGRHLA